MTSIERTPSGAASKSHNRRVAVVAGALVLGLLGSGGLVLRGTEAAFNASVSNGPITYELDGKQHVVVGAGDTLWDFVMLREK